MAIDLRAALGKALALLTILAASTATKVDDEVVSFLAAINDSPALLEWFQRKFADDAAGVLSVETDPPAALVEEIKLRDLPWDKLIAALPMLIQIVKTLG